MPYQIPEGELHGFCVNQVNPKISPLQGCLVEFIITLILIWVCCGVWDKRSAGTHDSVTIRFGLTIAGLAMAGVRNNTYINVKHINSLIF